MCDNPTSTKAKDHISKLLDTRKTVKPCFRPVIPYPPPRPAFTVLSSLYYTLYTILFSTFVKSYHHTYGRIPTMRRGSRDYFFQIQI
jgi:hypothetical protein